MELTEVQKKLTLHQVIGAGNLLNEIGEKHQEYFKATAEIFAVMALLAQYAGIISDGVDLLDLMDKEPDNKLDVVNDAFDSIIKLISPRD